jgi:hypothetical protein
MPKVAKDYSKTIIYRIVCKDQSIPYVYVGATTDMGKRRRIHRSYCNKKTDLKIYNVINSHGGWENWDMVMLEEYPTCRNSEQSRMREREWYERLCTPTTSLNIQTPYMSVAEKREAANVYGKSYYENNKEAALVRQRAYYQAHKEEAREKYQANKDKLKEKREEAKKIEI